MDKSANVTIFLFLTTQILNISVQSIYCAVMLNKKSNTDHGMYSEEIKYL